MSTWFAALRTLLYMSGFVLLWGYVALAIRPFDQRIGITLPSWMVWVGIGLMVPGAALALTCGLLFATRGRGTPAPFDPPREFVALGPYRYTRNPMYLGALVLLIGGGLFLRSVSILLLALVLFAAAHLFVVLYEELSLKHRFGESYRTYLRTVNRWVPKRPAHPARET